VRGFVKDLRAQHLFCVDRFSCFSVPGMVSRVLFICALCTRTRRADRNLGFQVFADVALLVVALGLFHSLKHLDTNTDCM
jgi:hypothetical protein